MCSFIYDGESIFNRKILLFNVSNNNVNFEVESQSKQATKISIKFHWLCDGQPPETQ